MQHYCSVIACADGAANTLHQFSQPDVFCCGTVMVSVDEIQALVITISFFVIVMAISMCRTARRIQSSELMLLNAGQSR